MGGSGFHTRGGGEGGVGFIQGGEGGGFPLDFELITCCGLNTNLG